MFAGSDPMPGNDGSITGALIIQKTASVLKYSSFVLGLLHDALATSYPVTSHSTFNRFLP